MSIIGSGDLAYNNLSIPMTYNDHFLNIIVEQHETVKVGSMTGKFYNPSNSNSALVSHNLTANTYSTKALYTYTPYLFSPITGYLCFHATNANQAFQKSAYDLVANNLNTHFYTMGSKTVSSIVSYTGTNPSIYCRNGGMVHFTSANVGLVGLYMNRIGNYTAQFGNNRVTGNTTNTAVKINLLSGDNPQTWFSAGKIDVKITADNGFTGQTYCISGTNPVQNWSASTNYWVADFYTYQ